MKTKVIITICVVAAVFGCNQKKEKDVEVFHNRGLIRLRKYS